MKALDCFSGIGGFALGMHWAGIETVGFVEADEKAQLVLKKNFPSIPIHGDIRKLDGTQYRGKVSIVSGGFPCQPWSGAGKRKGHLDNRDLWHEMLRIIREVKPRYFLGENVQGFVNKEMGLARATTDLEKEGFQTRNFLLPACGVAAPHQRYRIFIVGYSEHNGSSSAEECGDIVETKKRGKKEQEQTLQFEGASRQGCDEALGNSNDKRYTTSKHEDYGRREKRANEGEDIPLSEPCGSGSSLAFSKSERRECRETREQGVNSQFEERLLGRSDSRESTSMAYSECDTKRSALWEKAQRFANRKQNNGNKIRNDSGDSGEVLAYSESRQSRLKEAKDRREGSSGRSEKFNGSERTARVQLGGSFNGVSPELDGSINAWADGWEDGIPRVEVGVKNRTARLKQLGNSVVPQLVYMISDAIVKADRQR